MILVTLPTERVSWNYFMYSNRIFYESHAPHGACELKSPMTHWQADKSKSRSPRSVWVEIVIFKMPKYLLYRHAPHGACELKSCTIALHTFYCIVTLPTERVSWNLHCSGRHRTVSGHAPHGACELKYEKVEKRWKIRTCYAPHGACEWGRRDAVPYKILITENRG